MKAYAVTLTAEGPVEMRPILDLPGYDAKTVAKQWQRERVGELGKSGLVLWTTPPDAPTVSAYVFEDDQAEEENK